MRPCFLTGKIGSSVMASKILLYSVDVAQDHIDRSLQDWQTVEAALTPRTWLIGALRCVDELFLRLMGRNTGLVGYLDAFNERNALYVLINYIDAHEYALDKLQFILGIDQQLAEDGGEGGEGVNYPNGGGGAWGRSHTKDSFNTFKTGILFIIYLYLFYEIISTILLLSFYIVIAQA